MTFHALSLLIQSASPPPATTPAPHGMTAYEQVSLLLGLATVALGVLAAVLWTLTLRAGGKRDEAVNLLSQTQAKLADAERKIKSLQEHARRTPVIDYVRHDIVLLGPRHSGKTSIAKLWTRPWYNIRQSKASRKFACYEASIFEFKPKNRLDEVFGVERTFKKALRVRIHDYPGEERYQAEAVEQLPKLQNAVLILFFDLLYGDGKLSPTPVDENNRYYSKYFLTLLEQQENIVYDLARVIIVFNKIDLLPQDMGEAQTRKMLCDANADAVRRVEAVFGQKTDYRLLSAMDNRGAISLLGYAGSFGLPKEYMATYEQQLKEVFQAQAQYSDENAGDDDRWAGDPDDGEADDDGPDE
jgi:GTPase SAR1 family protein